MIVCTCDLCKKEKNPAQLYEFQINAYDLLYNPNVAEPIYNKHTQGFKPKHVCFDCIEEFNTAWNTLGDKQDA